jgi:tetratricopeptide (TPR) repeat protein
MTATAAPAEGLARGWRRWLVQWLVLVVLAAGGVALAERLLDRPPRLADPAPLDPAALRPGYGPRNYAEAIAAANERVASWRARASREPTDWLFLEGLAEAFSARFRLSGDFADLAEADRLLGEAMARAPWPSGPVFARAAVSLSAHRLDAAQAALQRVGSWAVPPSVDERQTLVSIRCEIALQRGRLYDAEQLCASGEGSIIRLRQANIAAKAGAFAEAARIVEGVLRKPRLGRDVLAVLALQRASIALESGDWAESGRWARAADRIFPGYWLAEAYVAQQCALEGRSAEAAERFRRLAERTGNADVIDAYLQLLQRQGRKQEAAAWRARADRAWRERMRLLPEAGAAHYAVHLFAYGDPREALELAELEYRRRPTASAAVTLAAALTREGRVEAALAILRATEARGWNTAELKREQASLLRALGRDEGAARAWQAAVALNPRIGDPAQRLVLFYQH